jgi:GT2 family glycosyltransferase
VQCREAKKVPGISNSIVVVNYNGMLPLMAMLKALRMEESTNTELIVVDNASFDESVSTVRQQQLPSTTVMPLKTNRGFWAAANAGIDRAEGDMVVLCHSDILADVHTLAELADQTREAGSRKVAAMVPGIMGIDGKPQSTVGSFPGLGAAVVGGLHPTAGLRCHAPTHDHLAENQWARFACVAINREMFGTVGAFDTRFFLFCGDIDWCSRVHYKQLRILLNKTVVVTHAGPELCRDLPDHLLRILRKDELAYAGKHLPAWQQGLARAAAGVGGLFKK